MDKKEKVVYDWKIGVWKSIKNVLVTFILPAAMILINSYTEWLPPKYATAAAPFLGIVGYFIKNYYQITRQ